MSHIFSQLWCLVHADIHLCSSERQEYAVFRELLRMVPGLEAKLMESLEVEVIHIADLVRRGFMHIKITLTSTDPERCQWRKS